MRQDKLSVRFLLRKSRANKKGKSPIYCRITYLGQRKNFATGKFINEKYWDSRQQCSLGHTNINSHLKRIHNKLEKSLLYLQLEIDPLIVEDIYKGYPGRPSRK